MGLEHFPVLFHPCPGTFVDEDDTFVDDDDDDTFVDDDDDDDNNILTALSRLLLA